MASASGREVYEKVRAVSYGALVTITGTGVKRLLVVITNVLLTRYLRPLSYSAFALCWRVVQGLKQFIPLGSTVTVVRDGARSRSRSDRSETAMLAYGTTLIGGLLFSVSIYLLAPVLNFYTLNVPELTVAFGVAELTLPFTGLVLINGHFLRGQEKIEQLLLLKDIGWPLTRLLSVIVALYLSYELIGVLAMLCLGTALLGISGVVQTLRVTDTGFRVPSLNRMKSFYNHSIPSALTYVGKLLRIDILIFFLGFFAVDQAPGQYNVILLLGKIAIIPLIGFNKLLPPIASDLYARNEVEILNDTYKAITRLITALTLPLILFMMVFSQELLHVFGRSYVPAYGALIVFLLGRLVGNCVGATGWLLLMTDNQYLRLTIDWLLALINIPLSYYLIVHYGLFGASVVYLFQRGFQNMIQLVVLRKLEGLFPYDWAYLKPLVASSVMGVTMVVVKLGQFPIAAKVLLGGIVGTLSYSIVLNYLGLEELDRKLISGLRDGFRRFIEIQR
ncbi:MAG: oligosaccharide flippase family protein [bacterium]